MSSQISFDARDLYIKAIISTLIRFIQAVPIGEKSVVFGQWVGMLDKVAR